MGGANLAPLFLFEKIPRSGESPCSERRRTDALSIPRAAPDVIAPGARSVFKTAWWQAAGTGDYNHDGKADVLWQNASGNVAEWQMNGDHIAANLTVGSHSIDWHMV